MINFTLREPLVIDTETYYSSATGCTIKANKKGWVGGNWHYTHHKDFYCYLITWCDPETGRKGVLNDRSKFAEFINTELRNRTIIAHNAGFDIAVLQSIAPGFQPFNTFDTADMASYLQSGRSLVVSAKVLLGVDVDKGMRDYMDGKHYADIGIENQVRMDDYALADATNEAALFNYGKDKWPVLEQWMSNYNRLQNEAGVNIDAAYMQEQIDRVSQTRSKAAQSIPWVENIDTDTPLSANKLARYCREVSILPPASLAEDSDECRAWEAQYGEQFPVVAAIRDFRKSNTYYKKLMLIERLLRPEGTIPLATKYAAAPHTLRFSATQFNYQSLPRNADYCDLRGCLIPAAGHSFIGADLAGIEARCLPWLAGDRDYLGQVAALDAQAESAGITGGGDIYEPAARKMFGYADPRPLKRTDKELRNATKVCVLQLGYQSGAGKFHWYINTNVEKSVLDRVRVGTETDEALALRLVKLYRSMNPRVQSLWYNLDGELRTACTTGKDFTIEQPNGRRVNYYDLSIRINETPGKPTRQEVVGSVCRGDDGRDKLYGGKITENVCQEMARHVLVESIYNLHEAGFKTRMSIHDENVVEVPDDRATRETTREIERIMSTTPAWAPGLPLAADTSIMKRYAK